jgi:hypothetical protein
LTERDDTAQIRATARRQYAAELASPIEMGLGVARSKIEQR